MMVIFCRNRVVFATDFQNFVHCAREGGHILCNGIIPASLILCNVIILCFICENDADFLQNFGVGST